MGTYTRYPTVVSFVKTDTLISASTFQGDAILSPLAMSVCALVRGSVRTLYLGGTPLPTTPGGAADCICQCLTFFCCNTQPTQPEMHCHRDLVNCLSLAFILAGFAHLVHHRKIQLSYGRHMKPTPRPKMVPAPLAWFLQEMPSFLIPLLLMLTSHEPSSTGKYLLLGTFLIHYFQR